MDESPKTSGSENSSFPSGTSENSSDDCKCCSCHLCAFELEKMNIEISSMKAQLQNILNHLLQKNTVNCFNGISCKFKKSDHKTLDLF